MKQIKDTNYVLLTRDEYKTLVDNTKNITIKYEYGGRMKFEGNIALSEESHNSICLDLYDKFQRIDKYYSKREREYDKMLESNAYNWQVIAANAIEMKLLNSRILRLFNKKITNIINKYIESIK